MNTKKKKMELFKNKVRNRVHEINFCNIYNIIEYNENIIKIIIDYQEHCTTPKTALESIIERIGIKNFIVEGKTIYIGEGGNIEDMFSRFPNYELHILGIITGE